MPHYTGSPTLERVPNAYTENMEYGSFTEVITEVRDVLILDLAHYTVQLPSDYASCLQPEPEGIYLYGALNPIAVFDPRYPLYSKPAYEARMLPDITTYEQFIGCAPPIVNSQGSVIAKAPRQNARHYRNRCTYNRSAIYLAAIHLWDILNNLHRETQPYTNLGLQQLVERQYLLQDIDPSAFRIDGHPGILDLQRQVQAFIHRDIHAVYALRMNNSVVHIEKGLDYRVIEYYRQRFEELDARIASDFGF